jgi:hypothetical protein
VVELFVFSPVLKRFWLALNIFPAASKANIAKPGITVWVNKRSGLYYCADSKVYGKLQPGGPMLQGEALTNGYRPAGNEACR